MIARWHILAKPFGPHNYAIRQQVVEVYIAMQNMGAECCMNSYGSLLAEEKRNVVERDVFIRADG